MNVTSFFKHWSINENPFMAEEARQDDVFARLKGGADHPDLHKIFGEPTRPASAVVFGEKGSGKTAIRLSIADRIRTHNAKNLDQRVLVIAYDELNPVLDRFARRVKGKSPLETLEHLQLVDHIDGLLSLAVPDLVDSILGRPGEGRVELEQEARSTARKMEKSTKQDWVLLQALYDRPDRAAERGRSLARRIRLRHLVFTRPLRWLALLMWIALAIGSVTYAIMFREQTNLPWFVGVIAGAVLTFVVSAKVVVDWFRVRRLSRQISNQLRVLDRSADSFRASIERLPWKMLAASSLPVDDLDDPRYEMLERLRRAVRPFGYGHVLVLVDRVDEPTLVNGETDRMKAVVFPLFNNKFLQLDHFAFKLMLPLELRHELYRQNSDFFQEARLDKQNMIDRLAWSGAMLYDLCTARVNACRDDGGEPLSLTELFDESVTRQDIVDALDQMRQPRDAFKMMYQVIQEHCASTTEEESNWRIPKLILDQVRRTQSNRLEGLTRGQRPA